MIRMQIDMMNRNNLSMSIFTSERLTSDNSFAGIIHKSNIEVWSGKTTTIRVIAVRETGVSRHHGTQLRTPMKSTVHHSSIILRSLRESLDWAPIMPRDSRLSDSVRLSGLDQSCMAVKSDSLQNI